MAEGDAAGAKASAKKARPPPKPSSASAAFKLGDGLPLTIQIVAGSYDRVLHGVTATVRPSSVPAAATKSNPSSSPPPQHVDFADTFLFNAHNSAIRCLALSPPSAPAAPGQPQKVLLATGSTDERINIYNLSAHPPPPPPPADHKKLPSLSSVAPRPILENPAGNRELGTLLHHGASVTRLAFPNRAKLLSAAEDATVAVTRTRDWTLLHAFRCPVPKAAAAGVVNDFAVHPSSRIMISVGRGERCMRLWNLETGKKSRVLNFERAVLAEIGEAGRHATGEARRIVWGSSCSSSAGGEDGEGEEEFAVGFDRDVLVFGMDCRPRCRLMRDTRTKVHELCYVETDADKGETVLAVSTEDGRVLFFSTAKKALEPAPEGKTLPAAKLVAQLGGKEAGVSGRVKDFTVLPVEDESGRKALFFMVTGGSDGRIRLWQVGADDLGTGGKAARQVGKLLGTYETQNRITCVGAFIMIPRPEGAEESEYEFDDSQEEDAEDSDDE